MKKAWLYIVVATVLFSSMETMLKFVSGQFNPIQLTFGRFLVGGLVLLPVALRTLRRRGAKLDGKSMAYFALLGVLGVALSMSFYQMAVTRIPASVVAVLFSSNPLFVALLAFLLLREPLGRNQVAGLLLDIVGIVVIVLPDRDSLDGLGLFCIFASTLLFAFYGVCGKKKCQQFGGVVVTCMSFLLGSAVMIVLAALSHIPALSAALTGAGLELFADIPFFTGYTLSALPVVLYTFIGVTGLGYTCYFLTMEVASTHEASLVFFFKPALAPVLAWLILREQIAGNMVAGIVLILAGSLLSLLPWLRSLARGRKERALEEQK